MFSQSSEKIVKIYRNGDPSNYCEIRFSKDLDYAQLADEIKRKLKLAQVRQFRLFNSEGLELFDEDIEFITGGTILYASKGEDFNGSSNFSEYEVIKQLGQGSFGKVVLAMHKTTKEKVAIKTVSGKVADASIVDMVFAEAEVLKTLKHKNIVKLYQCYTTKNMNIVFVMEYLEGGELGKYVRSKGRLDEQEAKFFFSQLADAIYYCHGEKLIHRDLKLENILLTSLENKIIKVVDFGVAGVMSNLNAETIEAGTLLYMPPEAITGKLKSINPALDIWSMGCILYQLLHGIPPFYGKTQKETIEKIKKGEYKIDPELEKKLSLNCLDLIKKMLNLDYKTRINILDVVTHPWLIGGNITTATTTTDDGSNSSNNNNNASSIEIKGKSNTNNPNNTHNTNNNSQHDLKQAGKRGSIYETKHNEGLFSKPNTAQERKFKSQYLTIDPNIHELNAYEESKGMIITPNKKKSIGNIDPKNLPSSTTNSSSNTLNHGMNNSLNTNSCKNKVKLSPTSNPVYLKERKF